jgi:MoxR-like ATPase
MLNIRIDYPGEEDEYRIIESTTSPVKPQVDRVVSAADLQAMQDLVLRVPAAPFVIKYAARLTRATRPKVEPNAPPPPDFIGKYVTFGAGPRAGQSLILAAKARAVLYGRAYVALEDVKAVALPVLRHRIMTNYHAEADGVTADDVVTRLLPLIPKEAD